MDVLMQNSFTTPGLLIPNNKPSLFTKSSMRNNPEQLLNFPLSRLFMKSRLTQHYGQ